MWPDRIVRAFAKVPPTTADESEYYGPYNKLLAHLFPLDGDRDYTICPRVGLPPSKDGSDTGVTFEVVLGGKPVFILEIKPPGFLDRKATRALADRQVRARLEYHEGPSSVWFWTELNASVEDCPIPYLHAVSALGTKLCFYTFCREQAAIIPPRVPSEHKTVVDVAPSARWEIDLLTESGVELLRHTVAGVDRQCAELGLE
jgi:hypothetical protein